MNLYLNLVATFDDPPSSKWVDQVQVGVQVKAAAKDHVHQDDNDDVNEAGISTAS